MEMKQVKSTSIGKVGYKRRTMNVEFQNGKSYEFKKVPRRIFDSFLKAPSIGEFFNDEIRKNYPYKEI